MLHIGTIICSKYALEMCMQFLRLHKQISPSFGILVNQVHRGICSETIITGIIITDGHLLWALLNIPFSWNGFSRRGVVSILIVALFTWFLITFLVKQRRCFALLLHLLKAEQMMCFLKLVFFCSLQLERDCQARQNEEWGGWWNILLYFNSIIYI